MAQVAESPAVFDAVVMGLGATRGWAAKVLTAGGKTVALLEARKKITPRDFTGHEPSWKLLNRHNRGDDVANLYVTDGAGWVASRSQNPTLTMRALTLRAGDHILNEHSKHSS